MQISPHVHFRKIPYQHGYKVQHILKIDCDYPLLAKEYQTLFHPFQS